jgi:hypothetical protein
MKQITLNIKDSQFKFFMELITKLDFVSVDKEENRLSSEQVMMLDKRLNDFNSDSYENWEDIKGSIEKKYEL